MNRFDEFALEEALLIKEKLPGTLVDALSVGPERASSNVQRALGMGADHGIHILIPSEGYMSPFTVASLIAAFARTRNYDLIMTGVMAEDTMACQTGQLIAALLDLPCATSVIKEEVRPESGKIVGGKRNRRRKQRDGTAQNARSALDPARNQFSQVPVLFQGDAGTDLSSGAHQGRGSRHPGAERILSWGANSRGSLPRGFHRRISSGEGPQAHQYTA